MMYKISQEMGTTTGRTRDIFEDKIVTRKEMIHIIGELMLGADRCEVTPESFHFSYLQTCADGEAREETQTIYYDFVWGDQ